MFPKIMLKLARFLGINDISVGRSKSSDVFGLVLPTCPEELAFDFSSDASRSSALKKTHVHGLYV